MRFIYPAIVSPREDGSYEAYVPDLEGCRAKGFSIDDCLEEINAAVQNWISLELEEDNPFLPPVSDHEDLAGLLGPGDQIRNVCVTYRILEGWDE